MGSDDYVFAALPGGTRISEGVFSSIKNIAEFWSSSEKDESTAWYRRLSARQTEMYIYSQDKTDASSIRCLKNN